MPWRILRFNVRMKTMKVINFISTDLLAFLPVISLCTLHFSFSRCNCVYSVDLRKTTCIYSLLTLMRNSYEILTVYFTSISYSNFYYFCMLLLLFYLQLWPLSNNHINAVSFLYLI